MTTSRAAYYPTSFFWGLAATVAAVVAGASLYGGGAWAWSAFVGAAAVGADFVFLAIFSVTWVEAARRSGRGLIWRGLLALAAKMLAPGAVVTAALWSGAVDVYPAAFGALAVAGAAPVLIVIHLLRQTSKSHPVP